MQNDRLQNGRYLNWIKTSLGLLYLKKGITDFSNETANDFHQAVSERVALRSTKAANSQCGRCTSKQAVKNKNKEKKTTTWRMNCRANICDVWLEEMLPYHKHLPCPNIAWENSDPCLWPTDSWELAKVFQPFGCRNHNRAEDSDATVLLTMILDCKYFSKFISKTATIEGIRNARNTCMHSSDMEMSDADTEASLELMVSFLEEPYLKRFQSCCDAAEKIMQLRDNELDLSLNKELEPKALNEAIAEIEEGLGRLAEDSEKLHAEMNSRTTAEFDHLRFKDKLGEIGNRLYEVKGRLHTLERMQYPDMSAKIAELTNRMQELEKESEKDNRKLDDFYKEKMAKLEAELQDLKTEMQVRRKEKISRSSSISWTVPLLSLNRRRQLSRSLEENIRELRYGSPGVKYPVFLAYSSSDEDVVMDKIYPSVLHGLQIAVGIQSDFVCSALRHFLPGRYITEEIHRCLEISGVFMAVVTENFCRSQHCLYEFRQALEMEKPIIQMHIDGTDEAEMSSFLHERFHRYMGMKNVLCAENNGVEFTPNIEKICEKILQLMRVVG